MVEAWIAADVARVPGAELRVEVGRRAPGEAFLPVGAQEGVEVRRAERDGRDATP